MAAAKRFLGKSSYQFLSKERDKSFDSEPIFEFDEADVWSSNRAVSPEYKRSIPRKSVQRGGGAEKGDQAGATARSLPVNIPDWSKILRDDSRVSNRRGRDEDDDDDDDEDGAKIRSDVGRVLLPPHEYLARQLERKQIASFSVREGIGRTLKGRDLSRVRDAVWEKTGFED